NIPAAQIDWLRRDLTGAGKPTIVFLHQLLDGEGAVYVNNAAAVRKVLEASGNTLAVFQGHHHAGGYRQIEGIHYCTLRAMVEGAGLENNAYAIVEVRPGRIVVEGYRRAVDRTMETRDPANSG
ncbi:MAG: metallophosphoesterase family protein, partial [Thermoguttaceae bacterium]